MPGLLRSPRFLALVACCLLLAAACATAGVWQIERLGAKRQANTALRSNDAVAPVPVDDLLAPGRPADPGLRFRRVVAAGRYDPAGQVLVRRRQVGDRLGFVVLTPLRTERGALLVARGFVPATGAATDTPPTPAPPAGPVTVTGRVYPSETGGVRSGLPPGQVDRIDTAALAGRLGEPVYGGYAELITTDPPDPGLAVLPPPDLGNPAGGAIAPQHLAYVIQWFLFALLALAGPYVFTVLDRGRPVRADRVPAPGRPGPAVKPADGLLPRR